MRQFENSYHDKLKLFRELFPDRACITIPQAARAVGMDADSMRADPTLPVFKVGSRRKVEITSLARWLTDKEYGK